MHLFDRSLKITLVVMLGKTVCLRAHKCVGLCLLKANNANMSLQITVPFALDTISDLRTALEMVFNCGRMRAWI